MVDLDAFIRDGFVKLEQAAPRDVADAARGQLWRQIGLSPQDPGSWTSAVVWTADLTGTGAFGELTRSPRLAAALDTLCGAGGWSPLGALGNIPVRFPVSPPAEDRGWHIDLNTPLPDGRWAVSRHPHTLLLLTLLSDVGPDDAPTRIRVGSHRIAAAALPVDSIDHLEAGRLVDATTVDCPVVGATGQPGDMYLLHPLTVHAADIHRGEVPRFMAQTPIPLTEPLTA
ncbi:phytanoyl-CoA dioxygenase family protein [Mycolicibacterium thermoresistibile]